MEILLIVGNAFCIVDSLVTPRTNRRHRIYTMTCYRTHTRQKTGISLFTSIRWPAQEIVTCCTVTERQNCPFAVTCLQSTVRTVRRKCLIEKGKAFPRSEKKKNSERIILVAARGKTHECNEIWWGRTFAKWHANSIKWHIDARPLNDAEDVREFVHPEKTVTKLHEAIARKWQCGPDHVKCVRKASNKALVDDENVGLLTPEHPLVVSEINK